MNFRIKVIVGVIVLIGILLLNSVYEINQTQRAVKLQFGAIVEKNISAGWHLKLPFVQNVKKFDIRNLSLDSPPLTYLTSEKKGLIVDAFTIWKIVDLDTYYRATSGGDESRLARLVQQRVDAGLRNEFGLRTVREVVSGEREEIMQSLTRSLNEVVLDEIGIEIVDVRLKKIELPSDASESVYRRMRTERERLAQELRAEGQEIAESIRAEADQQKVTILAEAFRKAETVRGSADAEAIEIYADAFGKDTEFFNFMRSLQSYEKAFVGKDNNFMIMSMDSEYFKFFGNKEGKE